jgi:hypothetical protein
MKKYILLFLVLSLIASISIVDSIYLVKSHDRAQTYTLPKEVKADLSEIYISDELDLIKFSIKYTADHLKYSEKNELDKGKANCIGYAQYCAAVANLLMKNVKSGNKAKPVVGTLKLHKLNLCQFISTKMPNSKWRNFTKDHDFVEFQIGDDIIYADPSLYDYTGKEFRTWKKK